jgi:hypothetical protein
MYMKIDSANFVKLAEHLKVGPNFESVLVEVGDGSLEGKEAGLNCIAMGKDSQVLMSTRFFSHFFRDIVGHQAFNWDSERMAKYAGFMKEEDHVMLDITAETITVESFDEKGNRVERIVMPAKPKEAVKNPLERFPSDFIEVEGTKYPDVRGINVKRGNYDIRVKVDANTLQKIVRRALEFNKFHFPVSFKEGKLNIQSGAHLDRAADSYDRNIDLLDSEVIGDNEEAEVNCGPTFLNVLQVATGEIFMDIGNDTPIWLTTRDFQRIEEKKGDKTSIKLGEQLYECQYFIVPRVFEEKEVKQAATEEVAEGEPVAEALELDL